MARYIKGATVAMVLDDLGATLGRVMEVLGQASGQEYYAVEIDSAIPPIVMSDARLTKIRSGYDSPLAEEVSNALAVPDSVSFTSRWLP